MFRPSIHGWPFPNAHSCTGAELGIGGPPPPDLGLGGGMCWAALDRYLRGVAVTGSQEPPAEGDPLHVELVQRQIAALSSVWPRVGAWQNEPDGSWRDRLPLRVPIPGRDLASRTRAEWTGIHRRLRAGEPVLLTLLPRTDGYDRLRSIRQVLATGWTRQGSRITVSVYDPDRPGDDDVQVTFDLTGLLDARISGGGAIRGFFAVGYDRRPPAALRAESFGDRSVIGLNREVKGRVSPAIERRQIDLIARNDRGALIHFQRARGRHWQGRNVTEAEDIGAFELHSDPVAVHSGRSLHAFGRSYVGDLLHFRLGRSWSVSNRTDHKSAGPQFRLAGQPVPVAGPGTQLGVVSRDQGGGLVHYHTSTLRGWRAEQVPGDPVSSDPVAAASDDALHVVAVADDGRLIHWVRQEEWAMTDPDAGSGPSVRLTGTPGLRLVDGRAHVFGCADDGRLALMTLGAEGEWARTLVGHDVSGDPVATRGPAGTHVFAPTGAGGLIHAWGGRAEWQWEDVVDSRPALDAGGAGPADVACWGSERELRAFVRRGRTLRAFTWTADADWVTETVQAPAGDAPIAFEDDQGRPHMVFTDGRGTVQHVETGPWKEPGSMAVADAVAVPEPTERREPAAGAAAPPDESDEPPPSPSESEPDAREDDGLLVIEDAAEAEETADEADGHEPPDEIIVLEDAAEEAATAPDEAPVLDEGADHEEEGEDLVEPLPALEPEPAAEDEDLEVVYLDDDWDGSEPIMPEPDEVELDEVELDEVEPDEVEPDEEPRPAAARAGEDAAVEPEPEAAEPETAEPDAADAVAASSDAEPGRKFRWDKDEGPPPDPGDVELMDLSLLDTWPEPKVRSSGGKSDDQEEPAVDSEDEEADEESSSS